ncbi:MAG: hypothetical protein Q8O89_03920 [Nanoarchaeota archaeon]|nr:hypothetical protein [Nanoarchaeota archaeon]
MNTLSKEDALLFHKLMNSLLFYVNTKTGLIKNANNSKEFLHRDIAETMPLRKKIFSDKYNFIDNYITGNPDKFNEEELKIIASWKKYKADKFFVVKHAKEYSLFFNSDSQKVYGVKGITDSFEEKFRGHTPVLVDITLIPFKEHMIYDGVFAPYPVSFGGGMRRNLKQESEEAVQQFGIITDLNAALIVKPQDDEEMLRFYMKSVDNKFKYGEEIKKLKKKSKELEAIFCQEEARDYARGSKKMLKDLGIKGYFAVLLHTIVASGESEKELRANMEKIIPEDKRNWIYEFKL